MPADAPKGGLVPAMLKYWRGRKGLSQLDLAIAADVSARHVSFMETGRAAPSREMLLKLGAALGVPLRDQNGMLRAAGMEPEFDEPDLSSGLPSVVSRAIEQMLHQQEPYPLVVMNRRYDVLRTNRGAMMLIQHFIEDPAALGRTPLNAFHSIFDPALLRNSILDWETVGRNMLWRLHREALDQPEDEALAQLLREIHAHPDVPDAWRHPDLSVESPPVFAVRVRKGDLEMGFITTMTAFNAPQNVTLEELRIESYFPADDATAELCRKLAPAG